MLDVISICNIYIIKDMIPHNRNLSHIRVDGSCVIFKTAELFLSFTQGVFASEFGWKCSANSSYTVEWVKHLWPQIDGPSIALFSVPQVKINFSNKFVKVHPDQLLAGVCASLHQNTRLALHYLFQN